MWEEPETRTRSLASYFSLIMSLLCDLGPISTSLGTVSSHCVGPVYAHVLSFIDMIEELVLPDSGAKSHVWLFQLN